MASHPSFLGLLIVLAAVAAPASAARAQVTETFVFRDSFLPTEGAGNTLEAVFNGAGTIVTGGPDFVDGMFVDATISATACPSAPTVRAWSFPASGGLRYPNLSPAVVSGSYSISMLLRFDPMDAAYARLIDFSNSTADAGIYKLGDGVRFYPVGSFAAGSFVEAQDVFVTITRDATSQLVSLYINGTPSGTYVDTGNLYVPTASTMYFLMDNTSGSAAITEVDPGVISYLQVRDTPMTPEEVAASLAAICDTVACGDGTVEEAETCDDGGVVDGDGCSATCTIEPDHFCTGSPSTCAPVTACTSSEYEATPPTATSDRVCTALTECAAGEYESVPATATSDRECLACTICPAGTREASACSGTADAVCEPIPDAGPPDAGPPDAGPPDAGAPLVDAAPGADASPVVASGEGGCGCVTAGTTPGARGTGLAALMLLALVTGAAARRARRRPAR